MAFELIEKLVVEGVEKLIVVCIDLRKFDLLEQGTFDVSLGAPGCFNTFVPWDSSASSGMDPFLSVRYIS